MSKQEEIAQGYLSPRAQVCNVTVEKKSRFITRIAPVATKAEAMAILQEIREREVGANHNCYAYIVGGGGKVKNVHCSDDGEPSGTAGKPMLSILQYENLGNIIAVVTRYFGGVKLGSGGLVRAYSGGVKAALEIAELEEYVSKKKVQLSFDYQFEGAIRNCCDSFDVLIAGVSYESCPVFNLEIVEETLDSFISKIQDITSGKARVEIA